ncbi:MAG: FtsW/RodA/SpoVE family cell cycle protein [Trueperaceae bacterium]|nr:FtsW/RodA/SpoVE family cell cycle protein [Trueperaceae bacterium]
MDRLLLTAQVMLGALGVLGVAAAAPALGFEHGVRVLAALIITVVVARIPLRRLIGASPWLYGGTLLLLILVLIIGSSPAGSESRRWLLIGGVSIQPSELMKVAVPCYLAAFFHNHLGDWQIWRPMLVVGLAAGLIVAEPDVSTALFLFALAFAVMLAAGTTLTRLASISVAAALIALVVGGPYLSQFGYLSERIGGFQDLWGAQADVRDSSYQAYQARRALTAGGLIGIGVGRPVPVPEAETDMVAVSIGRSLGLLGLATLVVTYLLIASRGLRIAAARAGPGSLLAAGATAYVCGQAALNLLVASGLFPVTGIPLPFVSYGMNSLVSVAIAFGFLHAAHREARQAEDAAEGQP